MIRRAPVGSIHWYSDSGSGGTEVPEFNLCLDVQDPQIHEVWSFGSGVITLKVHPTGQVDFGAGVVGDCTSNYLTESGIRFPILGQISINGSVEYLEIPDFHSTGDPFWDSNPLAPCSCWGDGGTSTNQNWGIQPGGPYGFFSVPWPSDIPARPDYVPRSPETRASLRAASVTITFEVGVCRACVVPLPAATPSVIRG